MKDFKHHLAGVPNEADGTIILSLPEVAFLLSPRGRALSCLPDLVANLVLHVNRRSPTLSDEFQGNVVNFWSFFHSSMI